MLEEHFMLAGEGKAYWEQIANQYNADLYILFPHVNDSYNYYALLHMDEYILSRRNGKTLLMASDKSIFKAVPFFVKSSVLMHELTEHEIDAIIKYYALYEFTSKMTIISLTRPYNTYGENLLGVKGVTKEDLLCFDIFRFSSTPVKKHPVYDGDDKDLINFMKLGEADYEKK